MMIGSIARLVLLLLVCTGSLVLVAGLENMREATQIQGFSTLGDFFADAVKPVTVGTGTFFGLITAALFDRIRAHNPNLAIMITLRSAVSTRDMLIAGIVAPLVLCTIYDRVAELQSLLLSFLFAYQNGFFWESIVGKAAPTGAAAPTPKT